jgi:hypothetical protein
MAGTRGFIGFRGEQIRNKVLRDNHFDTNNKINENKVDIKWHNHREILQDTKVDVFIQKNGVALSAGSTNIEVTENIINPVVAVDNNTEGTVVGQQVLLRKAGTVDFPFIDHDGDKVYGKLRFENNAPVAVTGENIGTGDASTTVFNLDFTNVVDGTLVVYKDGVPAVLNTDYTADLATGVITFVTAPEAGVAITADYEHDQDGSGKFFLDFFSDEGGVETAYTFTEAVTFDYKYVTRTNLSVIPVDAIVTGGGSFVEGATDAKAYMNLQQLLKDVYGASGTLDGDGNANLSQSLAEQVDDFHSTVTGKGAELVGVTTNENYTGVNVQSVLDDLAARLKDSQDRLTDAETKNTREVYEAVGGETSYTLVKGIARPETLFVALNGQLLAPGLHYEEIENTDGNVTGVNFDPDTLQVTEGIPDYLFVWYEKVL